MLGPLALAVGNGVTVGGSGLRVAVPVAASLRRRFGPRCRDNAVWRSYRGRTAWICSARRRRTRRCRSSASMFRRLARPSCPSTWPRATSSSFNGSLLHGSQPHCTTDRFRRSFIGDYMGRSTERIGRYHDARTMIGALGGKRKRGPVRHGVRADGRPPTGGLVPAQPSSSSPNHVRAEPYGLLAGTGLADRVEAGLACEEGAQPGPYDDVVVHDQDAQRSAVRVGHRWPTGPARSRAPTGRPARARVPRPGALPGATGRLAGRGPGRTVSRSTPSGRSRRRRPVPRR